MWRKNILELLGWDTEMCMSDKDIKKIKPCVACLSHTSKWELFIFSLYKFHYKFKRGVLVMAPQYHKLLGKFAHYIDCIPSTRLEDTGLGFVKNTAKFMKDNADKYDWIIIAPEGSLRAKEWKSGYYWLAKELGWEIRVTGLDFERLNTWISKPISSKKSKEAVEKFLKKQMGKIVPLNEEGQIVRVRNHLQPTVVNYYNVMFITCLLLSLSLLIVYIIRCIKC